MYGVISGLKNEKQGASMPIPTIKISPVKIPNGAVRIGNYILGKTIGSGSYGKVHLGLHIPTGERVAVKIIQKAKLSEKDRENINREIEILKRILHPSLIQLYEIIETQKSLLFVTEFMPNGQLFNYIIQRQKLSEDESCKIFHQIIEGLEYLHGIGITHRDIKPQNILIDYNGRIKIIDFGLSNFYQKNEKLRTQCGSPCYAAPQMIEGKHKYEPLLVDVWSSGVVLFSMIAGYLPFCDPDIATLYKKILAGVFRFPAWISEDAKDLISKMLVLNPSKRIKLSEILEHPWYRRIELKKCVGIDPKIYKVPFQDSIINSLESMGIDGRKLEQSIEVNLKSKQTALYYILAKKLTKEKTQITSYFCSEDFDFSLVKPWKSPEQKDSFESALAEVETISPIQVDVDLNSPLSDSQDPIFFLKSIKLLESIQEILRHPREAEDDKIVLLKGIFYCHNPQYNKRRHQLKIPNQKLERGKSLFTISKKKPQKSSKVIDKKAELEIQSERPNRSISMVKKSKFMTPNMNQLRKIVAQTKLTVSQIYAKHPKKLLYKKLTPLGKERPKDHGKHLENK